MDRLVYFVSCVCLCDLLGGDGDRLSAFWIVFVAGMGRWAGDIGLALAGWHFLTSRRPIIDRHIG